jgi:hypothetical protein
MCDRILKQGRRKGTRCGKKLYKENKCFNHYSAYDSLIAKLKTPEMINFYFGNSQSIEIGASNANITNNEISVGFDVGYHYDINGNGYNSSGDIRFNNERINPIQQESHQQNIQENIEDREMDIDCSICRCNIMTI